MRATQPPSPLISFTRSVQLIASLFAVSALSLSCAQEPTSAPPAPSEASTPPRSVSGAVSRAQKRDTFKRLSLPSPSLQRLNTHPKLKALKATLEQASERELEVGADLFSLAWARALSESGDTIEAVRVAQRLISSTSSTSRDIPQEAPGARWLLADLAPCDVAEPQIKALKELYERREPPSAWGSVAKLELSWARRCAHDKLPTLTGQVAEPLSLSSLPPERQLEGALELEKNRAYEAALEVLTRLSHDSTLSAQLTWRAVYERARLLITRIRRDFSQEGAALERLARQGKPPHKRAWREARLLAAKAWAKAREPKRSREAYRDLIKEWPHSDEAKTARFMLAFSHYEAQEWREAARAFSPLCRHQGDERRATRLSGLASREGWTRSAEWYHAWSLYQGSPRRAAPFLAYQVGKGLPTSEEGRRAAYWAAQAYEHHDPQRARALREALLQGDPLDWYSLLVRATHPQLAQELNPLSLKRSAPSPQPINDPSLHTPLSRLLIAERLELEGVIELEREATREHLSALFKARPPRERLNLLLWGREAGLVELSLRAAAGLAPQRLRAAPSAEEGAWWQLTYPWAFAEEVRLASEREGVSEALILSFIRKESAFDPRALSHAHARGLMQMLDKTAQGVAQIGAPLEGELVTNARGELALFQPALNVRLGARYLNALSERYHGQLPLVALAYNAGPQSLNRWLKASEGWRLPPRAPLKKGKHRNKGKRASREVPLDLFVERVPFKEARAYVKRLIKTYAVYELLYGERGPQALAHTLPLHIKTTPRAGVDF